MTEPKKPTVPRPVTAPPKPAAIPGHPAPPKPAAMPAPVAAPPKPVAVPPPAVAAPKPPPKPLSVPPPPEADEVTAVWDEDAARQHGFELEGKKTAPATAPKVGGHDRSSVVVSSGLTGRHAAAQPAKPQEPENAGLSWPVAIAIAIGVGVAVFFFVRMIR